MRQAWSFLKIFTLFLRESGLRTVRSLFGVFMSPGTYKKIGFVWEMTFSTCSLYPAVTFGVSVA